MNVRVCARARAPQILALSLALVWLNYSLCVSAWSGWDAEYGGPDLSWRCAGERARGASARAGAARVGVRWRLNGRVGGDGPVTLGRAERTAGVFWIPWLAMGRRERRWSGRREKLTGKDRGGGRVDRSETPSLVAPLVRRLAWSEVTVARP